MPVAGETWCEALGSFDSSPILLHWQSSKHAGCVAFDWLHWFCSVPRQTIFLMFCKFQLKCIFKFSGGVPDRYSNMRARQQSLFTPETGWHSFNDWIPDKSLTRFRQTVIVIRPHCLLSKIWTIMFFTIFRGKCLLFSLQVLYKPTVKIK